MKFHAARGARSQRAATTLLSSQAGVARLTGSEARRRPQECGRGRHECLRHIGTQ